MRGTDRQAIPNFELYDLVNDPREQTNLATRHPDIVESLRHEYEAWFQDVSSTRPDNYAPPRIILGSPQQPVVVLTKQDWRTDGTKGWGRQGKWLVRIEGQEPAPLEVTVRLLKANLPPGDATVILAIGEQRFEQQKKSNEKVVRFDPILVPPGDADLQVTIRHGDQEFGPHQVVVEQAGQAE